MSNVFAVVPAIAPTSEAEAQVSFIKVTALRLKLCVRIVDLLDPERCRRTVVRIQVPEPTNAAVACAVSAFSGKDLQQRRDCKHYGPNADQGREEATVLLDVKAFPRAPLR